MLGRKVNTVQIQGNREFVIMNQIVVALLEMSHYGTDSEVRKLPMPSCA